MNEAALLQYVAGETAALMAEHRITREDAAQAKAAPVPRLRKPMPVLAPHSADQAIATVKDAPVIKLTLVRGRHRPS